MSYSSQSSSTSIRRSWRDCRGLWGLSDEEVYPFDRLAERELPNAKHQREVNGLKGRPKRERARAIYTAEVSSVGNPVTGEREADTLYISDGRATRAVRFLASAEANSRALLAALAPIEAGALVVFAEGARRDFHLILNSLGRALTVQGWRLYPLAARSEVRGLILTLDKRSWWFCDREVVMGARPDWAIGPPLDYAGPEDAREGRLTRLYHDLDRLQVLARQHLGVALHATIGATGVAAARQSLPEGFIWWKPPSLLREACLRGGAYRGGWQYAVPYRGEAWKVDITRAYTWALGLPLPCRYSFGRAHEGGEEKPGVFLCRVEGYSEFPVPLAAFDADRREFCKEHSRRRAQLSFLPQAEYAALRALGYKVTPLVGWTFAQFLSLSPLTDRLAVIARDYPRDDPFSHFGKALANALTGKLGQGPRQDQVCYSAERPDEGWWPFVSVDGEVIDYLWVRPSVEHRAYQQSAAAALITSRVRSKTITYALGWEGRRGQVVYADTDGLLLAGKMPPTLPGWSDTPGDWRLVGHDRDCEVIGRKRFTWQGVEHPVTTRARGSGRLAIARQSGELMVGGRVSIRQWDRNPRAATETRTTE